MIIRSRNVQLLVYIKILMQMLAYMESTDLISTCVYTYSQFLNFSIMNPIAGYTTNLNVGKCFFLYNLPNYYDHALYRVQIILILANGCLCF